MSHGPSSLCRTNPDRPRKLLFFGCWVWRAPLQPGAVSRLPNIASKPCTVLHCVVSLNKEQLAVLVTKNRENNCSLLFAVKINSIQREESMVIQHKISTYAKPKLSWIFQYCRTFQKTSPYTSYNTHLHVQQYHKKEITAIIQLLTSDWLHWLGKTGLLLSMTTAFFMSSKEGSMGTASQQGSCASSQ